MVKVTNWATLALVMGSLVGCGVPGMVPVGPKPGVVSPVNGLKGSVSLRVGGLVKQAYQLLAATDAIERLNISLNAGGRVYRRSLSRKALSQPEATVNFEAVPVGVVLLEVQALDSEGRLIGKGAQKAEVVANDVVTVPLTVKMAGSTGGVSATILFEEDEPAPPPHRTLPWNLRGFQVADINGDEYLDYAEFERYYPFEGMMASWPRPVVCRLPLPVAHQTAAIGAPVVAHTRLDLAVPIMPEVSAARRMFDQLDRHFDGFLSLDEFMGEVIQPEPQPTEVPLIQDCSMDFKVRDRDGDGRLSLTEWLVIADGSVGLSQQKAEQYARLDEDKDGFLSLGEFEVDCQGVRLDGVTTGAIASGI